MVGYDKKKKKNMKEGKLGWRQGLKEEAEEGEEF